MTAEIPLTRGQVALVDDADYDLITSFGRWCALVAPHTYYAVRAFVRPDGQRTTIAMHKILTNWPLVDHINRNGLDNQRDNLRPAGKSQNLCNSCLRTDNKSGFRGVSWSKTNNKWRALVHLHGRRVHLGYYLTPESAALAYDAAALELHGPFASLNFSQEMTA